MGFRLAAEVRLAEDEGSVESFCGCSTIKSSLFSGISSLITHGYYIMTECRTGRRFRPLLHEGSIGLWVMINSGWIPVLIFHEFVYKIKGLLRNKRALNLKLTFDLIVWITLKWRVEKMSLNKNPSGNSETPLGIFYHYSDESSSGTARVGLSGWGSWETRRGNYVKHDSLDSSKVEQCS